MWEDNFKLLEIWLREKVCRYLYELAIFLCWVSWSTQLGEDTKFGFNAEECFPLLETENYVS